jgi:hypothetical protein
LRYLECLKLDDGTDLLWDGKRRQVAGASIPTTFPARTQLLAAGYLVLEELQGANEEELTSAGLSATQAAAVVAAIG